MTLVDIGAAALSVARNVQAAIELSQIRVTNEAVAHDDISAALSRFKPPIEHAREVVLTPGTINHQSETSRIGGLIVFDEWSNFDRASRIDFLCGSVGIEVKARGRNKRDAGRQLERYCNSPDISAIVYAAPGSQRHGVIHTFRNKPVLFASLSIGSL